MGRLGVLVNRGDGFGIELCHGGVWDGEAVRPFFMGGTRAEARIKVPLTPGAWHLAPGTWHLAPGTWHLAPGIWHLAPGTWHLAPGLIRATCIYLIENKGTNHDAPGTWPLTPGSFD